MNTHSKNIFRLIKIAMLQHKPIRTEQIPAPQREPNSALPVTSYQFSKKFLVSVQDDDAPKMPWLIRQYLRLNDKYASFKDNHALWGSDAEATKAVEDKFGKRLPAGDVQWIAPTSDEALWRFVCQGNAAQNLEAATQDKGALAAELGGFVVRCEHMAKFEMREPFASYGGNAWFDGHGKPTRITLRGKDVYPHDKAWEAAKFAFRTSCFIHGAISDHLVRCHQGWSNALTLGCLKSLPKANPLRMFLKPFIYNGSAINNLGAMLFLTEHCWLHRTTGFSWKGLQQAFDYAIENMRIEPFDEELKRKGVHEAAVNGTYPFGQEQLAFWNLLAEFVDEAFEGEALDGLFKAPHAKEVLSWWQDLQSAVLVDAGPFNKANVKQTLKVGLFTATSYHWHVQSLSSYVRHANIFGTRLVHADQTIADIETHMSLAMVVCTTGLAMPTIDGKFDMHMPDQHSSQAARTFHSKILELQTAMDLRNANRIQPYRLCEPRRVQTSIGV